MSLSCISGQHQPHHPLSQRGARSHINSSNIKIIHVKLNSGDKEKIVLDLLQTKSDDAERENCQLKLEIERLKRETSSDSVAFNMKVVELQNKFHRVEEEIIMKNMEIARLKNSKWNTLQSNLTETEILEDTLRPGMFSAIYSSINANYSSKPFTKQLSSCLSAGLVLTIISFRNNIRAANLLLSLVTNLLP